MNKFKNNTKKCAKTRPFLCITACFLVHLLQVIKKKSDVKINYATIGYDH